MSEHKATIPEDLRQLHKKCCLYRTDPKYSLEEASDASVVIRLIERIAKLEAELGDKDKRYAESIASYNVSVDNLRRTLSTLTAQLAEAKAIALGVTHHETCCESSEKYKAIKAENERLKQDISGFPNLAALRQAMIDTADENVRLKADNKALLEALEEAIPFMEEAENNGLVGHEGCFWPVETARAAIAQAKEKRMKAAVGAMLKLCSQRTMREI